MSLIPDVISSLFPVHIMGCRVFFKSYVKNITVGHAEALQRGYHSTPPIQDHSNILVAGKISEMVLAPHFLMDPTRSTC